MSEIIIRIITFYGCSSNFSSILTLSFLSIDSVVHKRALVTISNGRTLLLSSSIPDLNTFKIPCVVPKIAQSHRHLQSIPIHRSLLTLSPKQLVLTSKVTEVLCQKPAELIIFTISRSFKSCLVLKPLREVGGFDLSSGVGGRGVSLEGRAEGGYFDGVDAGRRVFFGA